METAQEHVTAPSASGDARAERQRIRLERGLVESYLLAGLRWSAVRWREHPILLELGVECYRYLAGRFYDRGQRGFTHLPLFLVLDLMALIEMGERTPFASEGQAHLWSQEERRLRVDYENLLLGTLLQEPSFVDARERLAARGKVRRGASMRLAELLLQTFGRHYPGWVALDPAHLRAIALPLVQDIHADRAQERLNERLADPWLFADGLRALLHGVSNEVYWKELLQTEDLFEIENWAVLDSEAKRIGSRQISEIERRLGEFRLPRVRVRDEAMEVKTDFDDDTIYPTGGFSGLATRGSFENLVRSELVYMGEGAPISLFDLRFVESELLFYMRNDGMMRRKRRYIHVILDLDAAFHYKSPGYDYPFSTLTQGLIVRVARDLLSTFEEDAVTVHLHYLFEPGEGGQAARERERIERELALVSLVLGREIRQDRVRVDLEDDIDLEQMQHSKGRVYAIALAFSEERERFWRSLFDDLEHARPPVFGLTLPVGVEEPDERAYDAPVPLVLPLEGLAFAQVAEIKNAIYAHILSGRR